jgi:P27 family predicted phage terminase small subunit
MKSFEELKRSGTFSDSRHGDKVQAGKPKEVPSAPKHLTLVEKKIFSEIASLMQKEESLSYLDVYALEIYSVQMALFRRAKKALEKSGEYITTHTNKSGSTNLVPSPWLTVLKNTTDALQKLSAKLGLTPQDRSRVSKVIDNNKDESNSLIK